MTSAHLSVSKQQGNALRDAMMSVVDIILSHRITGVNENRLQLGLADVFAKRMISCEREVVLTAGERIDFLLDHGIGLECKVKDSPSSVAGQMIRYVQHDRIQGLILVTTKVQLGRHLPASLSITGSDGVIREKPICIAALWKSYL